MNDNKEWLNLNDGTKFHIRTYSDEDIDILNIARSLAFTCRYNGNIKRFYSVAEHSLLCEEYIDNNYQIKISTALPNYELWRKFKTESSTLRLWALLHDSGEFIFGDISRPLISLYQEAKNQEEWLCYRVLRKYGLSDEFISHYKHIIKNADNQVLAKEIYEVIEKVHQDFEYFPPDSIAQKLKINFYYPNQSLINRFIKRFNQIRKEIKKCQRL